jgi:hypothetical protein
MNLEADTSVSEEHTASIFKNTGIAYAYKLIQRYNSERQHQHKIFSSNTASNSDAEWL